MSVLDREADENSLFTGKTLSSYTKGQGRDKRPTSERSMSFACILPPSVFSLSMDSEPERQSTST